MVTAMLAGAVGLVLLGVLAFWWFDEKDQSEALVDRIERVGERSRTATGGFLGAAGSLLAVVSAIVLTTSDLAIDSIAAITSMIGADPLAASSIGVGILGFLGIRGDLSITPTQFGLVVAIAIVAGLIWRARGSRS